MRPISLFLLAGTVSAAVAGLGLFLLRPEPSSNAQSGFAVEELQTLRGAVEEMRLHNQSLQAELASLRASNAGASISREPALDELVERAVARAMAKYGEAQPGPLAAAAKSGETGAAFDAQVSVAALLNPFVTSDDRDRVWKAAHEAGQTEALIALIEARAKADPKNAGLQYELGNAYLQPIIQGEATGGQAGAWSTKADKTFDAVLALDENHWDARFNKAISYTFWPPVFGKQQEAINHFEILVGKQANMAPRPEFAQTYLFLGNMYEQTGNAAKAKEAWNLGLSAFPQDSDLRKRLGLE